MRSLTEIILLFFVSTSVLLGAHVSAAPSQPGYLAKRQDQKLQALAGLISQGVDSVSSASIDSLGSLNHVAIVGLDTLQDNVNTIFTDLMMLQFDQANTTLCNDVNARLSTSLTAAMNFNNSISVTGGDFQAISSEIGMMQSMLETVGISVVSTAPPTTTLVAREVFATSVPKSSLPLGRRQWRKRDPVGDPEGSFCLFDTRPIKLHQDENQSPDGLTSLLKNMRGLTTNVMSAFSQIPSQAKELLQAVQAGDDSQTKTSLSNILQGLVQAQTTLGSVEGQLTGFLNTLNDNGIFPAPPG